jgi:hypothetical protein
MSASVPVREPAWVSEFKAFLMRGSKWGKFPGAQVQHFSS